MALASLRTRSRPSGRVSQTGVALDKTLYILAANERDVFSEFLAIQLNQSAAVSGFFGLHAFEYGGGSREVLAQSFGEIGEDAFIFFFQGNGQRQNFALGKSLEVLHGG